MLLVVKANKKLPALTCQDVGRELHHKRYDVAQIVGDLPTLQKIAWIFQRVPDMFDVQFKYASLIVRRAQTQTDPVTRKDEEALKMTVRHDVHAVSVLENSMS